MNETTESSDMLTDETVVAEPVSVASADSADPIPPLAGGTR
jgi:hypothetical protein